MFKRSEMKQAAKNQLKGRWGSIIAAMVVFLVIMVVICAIMVVAEISTIAGINLMWLYYLALIACLLIAGPIAVGIYKYCLKFTATNEKLKVDEVFYGFKIFGKSLGIYWWIELWTFLWTLLLVIPGIIKALAYSQSIFIIAENPGISVRKALKTSIKMTKGYKWQIFVMGLSFIGWMILASIPLYIGYLWLMPYICVTYTNMYLKLKELALESGACTPADFGMEQ